jgi:phosphohistidine phosphatase
MDRELFLIRHAQAEMADMNQNDKDRCLTAQGSQDAMRLGNLMKSKHIEADYIACSTSMRTRETAEYICEQIEFDPQKIYFSEDLYESSVRIILNVINNLNDSYQKVYIISHNPAITYLAEYVTGEVLGNVSPCGMVHLKLKNMSWNMLSQDKAKLVKYYNPVDL